MEKNSYPFFIEGTALPHRKQLIRARRNTMCRRERTSLFFMRGPYNRKYGKSILDRYIDRVILLDQVLLLLKKNRD